MVYLPFTIRVRVSSVLLELIDAEKREQAWKPRSDVVRELLEEALARRAAERE